MVASVPAAIHWFRKGLRLHDNPALVEAATRAAKVYPVFILDPHFAQPDKVGLNRYRFLLESLADVDAGLRRLGSRLYVLQGRPDAELPKACAEWGVRLVTLEADSEPYARARDRKMAELLAGAGVEMSEHHSHTLRRLDQYLAKGKVPGSYNGFVKLFGSCGQLRPIAPDPQFAGPADESADYGVPTLEQMGYPTEPAKHCFRGGETEALRRLAEMVEARPSWAAQFNKPQTAPNALEPSTTVLSPYLKFGCLSARRFFEVLRGIYEQHKQHSSPPVSLEGQLLWREYFYLNSYAVPNFGQMEGNPNCRQIPWGSDPELLEAWKLGRTGYPFIDAIMTQLREQGWIHHLARHSTACFLTRGDLWQHWEAGMKVFDLYLLDADFALNAANWQWLSCSNFFYQYFRCYSPVAFGKKTDPTGQYIRKWLPGLKKLPDKFIYEPWKAPKSVQQAAGCVVGVDYPARIVIHEEVSKRNMDKMKAAYANQKAAEGKEPAQKKQKTN